MKTPRALWRFTGSKSYYANNVTVVICLVLLAGLLVSLTNIAIFIHFSSWEPEGAGSAALIPRVVFSSLIVTMTITVLTLIAVLFYSQKVTGPMHGLETRLNRVLQGNLDAPITVRQGDEFQGVGKKAEALRKKLYMVVQDGTTAVNTLEDKIKALLSQTTDQKNISRNLSETLEIIERLKKTLADQINM